MSVSRYDEWEELASTWRAAPTVPADGTTFERLRERVRRRTVWRVAALACEVVLTVAVVSWAFGQLPGGGAKARAMTITTCLFVAIVWAFGLWNGRHGWRVLGETSANFVRLSRARLAEARRSILAVRITLGLTALGLVPWLAVRARRGEVTPDEWITWVFFGCYLVAMFTWCAVYGRWVEREEATLREIERELE